MSPLEKLHFRTVKRGDEVSNGRGLLMAGLLGLALGVFLGNSAKRGSITKQVRSTGRTLMKRARGTVEHWVD